MWIFLATRCSANVAVPSPYANKLCQDLHDVYVYVCTNLYLHLCILCKSQGRRITRAPRRIYMHIYIYIHIYISMSIYIYI